MLLVGVWIHTKVLKSKFGNVLNFEIYVSSDLVITSRNLFWGEKQNKQRYIQLAKGCSLQYCL